jgi:hypothetical protein
MVTQYIPCEGKIFSKITCPDLYIQQPIMIYRVTISFVANVTWTGRAIAQAVSRWLPTAAARVQTRV